MDEAIVESKLSSQRLRYCALIIVIFLLGSLHLTLRNAMLIDELLCVLTIDIFFLVIFFLALHRKRVLGQLKGNRSTNYRNLTIVILVAWLLLTVFSYLPDFFAPVMLIVFLLVPIMDDTLAICIGLYMNCILCLTSGLSMYVMYCYTILTICGVLLAAYMSNKKDILGIHLIIFSTNIVVPVIFYYFAYLEIDVRIFLYGVVEGLVSCGFLFVYHRFATPVLVQEEMHKYDDIISNDYPLVNDIKQYSMAEYQHGLRVSRLSHACALEIHVKEKTAACGGFYYRLGKMEGEPEIDNAVKLATNNCFPNDVIEILKEYNGILRLPQTPESAIVHMVDHLVTKMELLNRNTMSSTWNQDMVIYQTLNELSQQGFYDQSGLTMNQFLKVREKLVMEDMLL